MKTKFYLLILVLIISSCKSKYQRDTFQYDDTSNLWINAFKYQVFYTCLKEGINNDTLYKIMRNKDLFNPYDDIDILERKTASELGKKVIENLPKPTVIPHCDDCNESLQNSKNYISNNCLKYYASKELDSIAKIAYKLHLKKMNGKNY